MDKLINIASKFAVAGNVVSVNQLGDGFINDTFLVKTDDKFAPRYILQRKNSNVFKNVPQMMDNIYNVTMHLKKKVRESGGDRFRNTLTVIPVDKGQYYYVDDNGGFWAMCIFIENTITYDKAETADLAYKAGRGLGKFQLMMSDFDKPLYDVLPGFHNMRMRFEQWDKALIDNLAGRKDSVMEEIEFIESHRKEMLDFMELVENGTIAKRVVHNDTKISNFLFNSDNDVVCVIDLDTVMLGTCLNDFGDAIRSITNTGLEDDTNLDNVAMDRNLFDAYKAGYLSYADGFLTDVEKEYLNFSARFITFEQVLRFLMDYLNGDTYYKIKYSDHNLVRTRAQRKLFETMTW